MALSAKIEELGIPYIIGADFQMDPKSTLINSWVDAMSGVIVAPDEDTCRSSQDSSSKIDYFVVHKEIAPYVKAVRVEEIESNPHRPVTLILSKAPREQWEYVAKRPRAFPEERQYGPQRSPTRKWEDMMDSNGKHKYHLDKHAKEVVKGIEEELIQIHDLEDDMSKGKSQYRGRAEGLQVKRVRAEIKATQDGCKATTRANKLNHMAELLARLAKHVMNRTVHECVPGPGVPWTWLKASKDGKLLALVETTLDAISKDKDTYGSLGQDGEGDDDTAEMLRNTIARIRQEGWMQYTDAAVMYYMEMEYRHKARSESKRESGARRNKYKKFMKEAVELKGGRIMHKMIKPTQINPPAVVWTEDVVKRRSSMDQANADAQRRKWKPIWGGSDKPQQATHQHAKEPQVRYAEVTHTEIQEMRASIKSFKKHTATSHDNSKPHEIAEVSNEAIRQLLQLFKRCETEGRWPTEWRHPCLVCIPKEKAGEFRLIALLHVYYRIWAKTAARGVSRWMAETNRDWIAFGPGCAAEDAAYDICLRTEAAEGLGRYTVTMISDLEKGFEKVSHDKIEAAADKHGFPKRTLQLALNMYKGARRIKCGDALSRPVYTKQGVLAGCPIAMGALCLAVIDPVDKFLAKQPVGCKAIKVYVDDFTVVYEFDPTCYTREKASAHVAYNTRCLHEFLRQEGLILAPSKSKIITKDAIIADKLQEALKDLGYEKEDTMKLLGVDWGSSEAISYSTAASRVAKAARAVANLCRYAPSGVKYINIARAHVMGAARYGCATMGLPPRLLARVRTLVRSATNTNAKGGSATVDMAIQKEKDVDPAYTLLTVPIQKWCLQAYDEDAERHDIQAKAWNNASAKANQTDDPWQAVSGPAGALIATLNEIGWSMVSWHEMVTHRGVRIDVTKARPTWVVQCAKDAVEVKLWHQSERAQQDLERNLDRPHEDAPWWEPLRKIINGKDKAIANAARSVVVGTQWPQARMHDAHMQVNGYECKACDSGEPGTMQHRHCRCPSYRDYRSEFLSAGSRLKLEEGFGGDLFAKYGILTKRNLPDEPKRRWKEPTWSNDHAIKWFRGTVYVDGSGKRSKWNKAYSTAAWAAVVMSDNLLRNDACDEPDADEDSEVSEVEEIPCGCKNITNDQHRCNVWCVDNMGCNGQCKPRGKKGKCNHVKADNKKPSTKPCQILSGALNGTEQTVPRAELEAIAQVLENGEPPLCIYTDHRNHVISFEKGRKYCCRAGNKQTDIWRRIWKRISDFKAQRGEIQIVWVKAHQQRRKGESREECVNREGNDAADAAAVAECSKHEPTIREKTQLDIRAAHVTNFVKMAAQIIVDQSAGKTRIDHDVKEPKARQQDKCTRGKRQQEEVDERIVRRKVVHVCEAVRSRITSAVAGDPYKGHGVRPDEMQELWERAVKEQKDKKREAVNTKTAAQRMQDIHDRVKIKAGGQAGPADTAAMEKAKAAVHNSNERQWLKDRERHQLEAAKATHPARTAGKIRPDEAKGHELRTGKEDSDTTWIWCRKCGAHTSMKIRALAIECAGHKNTAQKRRLEGGCNPYTAKRASIVPVDMQWCDVSAVAILRACQDQAADDTDDPTQRVSDETARCRFACEEADAVSSVSLWSEREINQLSAWDFRY